MLYYSICRSTVVEWRLSFLDEVQFSGLSFRKGGWLSLDSFGFRDRWVQATASEPANKTYPKEYITYNSSFGCRIRMILSASKDVLNVRTNSLTLHWTNAWLQISFCSDRFADLCCVSHETSNSWRLSEHLILSTFKGKNESEILSECM